MFSVYSFISFFFVTQIFLYIYTAQAALQKTTNIELINKNRRIYKKLKENNNQKLGNILDLIQTRLTTTETASTTSTITKAITDGKDDNKQNDDNNKQKHPMDDLDPKVEQALKELASPSSSDVEVLNKGINKQVDDDKKQNEEIDDKKQNQQLIDDDDEDDDDLDLEGITNKKINTTTAPLKYSSSRPGLRKKYKGSPEITSQSSLRKSFINSPENNTNSSLSKRKSYITSSENNNNNSSSLAGGPNHSNVTSSYGYSPHPHSNNNNSGSFAGGQDSTTLNYKQLSRVHTFIDDLTGNDLVADKDKQEITLAFYDPSIAKDVSAYFDSLTGSGKPFTQIAKSLVWFIRCLKKRNDNNNKNRNDE